MPDDKKVTLNYPTNSHKSREPREEKEETKKVIKIIKGTVVKKKKSLGRRFLDTFVADDLKNVGGYLIHDVLVPAAQNMITDLIQSLPELIFKGAVTSSRRGRGRDLDRSHVSYNNYSSRDKRDDKRDISPRNRSRQNFDDIILETKADANDVIGLLIEMIEKYGQATVADLYDMVGITEEFTDRSYGWTNLRSADVERIREGWMLILPKPIYLD